MIWTAVLHLRIDETGDMPKSLRVLLFTLLVVLV
jgi:hypothetical protein